MNTPSKICQDIFRYTTSHNSKKRYNGFCGLSIFLCASLPFPSAKISKHPLVCTKQKHMLTNRYFHCIPGKQADCIKKKINLGAEQQNPIPLPGTPRQSCCRRAGYFRPAKVVARLLSMT